LRLAGIDIELGAQIVERKDCSGSLSVQQLSDGVDRGIQALNNLTIGYLQPPRACDDGIQLASEARSIDTERVDLSGEIGLLSIALSSALKCRFERVERQLKPSRRRVDDVYIVHSGPVRTRLTQTYRRR
jgi:hypothetical protein